MYRLRLHDALPTRPSLILLDEFVQPHMTCSIWHDTHYTCYYCVAHNRVESVETRREDAQAWLDLLREVDRVLHKNEFS